MKKEDAQMLKKIVEELSNEVVKFYKLSNAIILRFDLSIKVYNNYNYS